MVFVALSLGSRAALGDVARTGDDVVAAFARAARGEPLRYVAIGGSITQASGDGWAGEWLREQFPESAVTVVNSGMSATGSSLGIFRADRDIIAHQPDLVAIEYCVNDGGLTDKEAMRYMETLVVRLKSLPNPPAIIIVEAAAKGGVNLERHRRVARHYGLVEVDMQAAMDAKGAEAWDEYFSDNVHPNKAGHAYYAETMSGVLAPLVARAKAGELPVPAELPAPLSARPLLLDARLVPLQGYNAPGWKSEASLPSWWNRFFQGVLTAGEPGTVLRVPVRGTTFGVFYAMSKDYGSFFVNVDGGLPQQVYTNTRGGYSLCLLGTNLPAREHVVTVALPKKSNDDARSNGPVKLGYLLVAGETAATREASQQGEFSADKLSDIKFISLAADAWQYTTPIRVAAVDGAPSVDARLALFNPIFPEPGDAHFSFDNFTWKQATGEGGLVDLRVLAGSDAPALAYARTTLRSEQGGAAVISLDVDYFAQLWINGERVLVLDGPHPRPKFFSVTLRSGDNEIFLKTAAGSAGHNFQLRITNQ
ncbi:MAG: GDSL-type esterase/lipase family protein [Opitutaceae bacterium]